MLEFIHMAVETLDMYFDGVSELDVRTSQRHVANFSRVPDHVQHRKGALHPRRDDCKRRDHRDK